MGPPREPGVNGPPRAGPGAADSQLDGSVDPGVLASLAPFAWYTQPRPLFSGGNEVDLLRGGDELFPAMCAAFARARHHIWLASYIFHDDASARAVAMALRDAAARGVRVRVVVDGFGSAGRTRQLRELLGPDVAFAVFRPVHSWWSVLQPEALRRLHQKLCVVDGEVAFVGGINIIDDRLDIRHGWSETARLDYAVRLRGPVVAPVEQTARAAWTRASLGHDWRDEVMDIARSTRPIVKARRLLRQLRHHAGDRHWRGLARALRDRSPVRAAFVVRDNFRQRRTIERSFIEAIARSRRTVSIVVPYFYPGGTFRRTLREAAGRGVQVRLLLQGKIDYRVAALAARVLYDELLSSGVRIYEYTPAYLHAKVAVVDDSWATVGSTNIDPLSLLVNLEANVIVRDPAFARQLAAEIEAALAQSMQISRHPRGRGWWPSLRRGFVAGCARLYLRVAGATGRY